MLQHLVSLSTMEIGKCPTFRSSSLCTEECKWARMSWTTDTKSEIKWHFQDSWVPLRSGMQVSTLLWKNRKRCQMPPKFLSCSKLISRVITSFSTWMTTSTPRLQVKKKLFSKKEASTKWNKLRKETCQLTTTEENRMKVSLSSSSQTSKKTPLSLIRSNLR